jgi:hypothetical protein
VVGAGVVVAAEVVVTANFQVLFIILWPIEALRININRTQK